MIIWKLCKIFKNQSPYYLFELIPAKASSFTTRTVANPPLSLVWNMIFSKIPSCQLPLKIGVKIRSFESYGIFKNSIKDHLQIVFSIVLIQKRLNILQYFLSILLICALTNVNIVFKIHQSSVRSWSSCRTNNTFSSPIPLICYRKVCFPK